MAKKTKKTTASEAGESVEEAVSTAPAEDQIPPDGPNAAENAAANTVEDASEADVKPGTRDDEADEILENIPENQAPDPEASQTEADVALGDAAGNEDVGGAKDAAPEVLPNAADQEADRAEDVEMSASPWDAEAKPEGDTLSEAPTESPTEASPTEATSSGSDMPTEPEIAPTPPPQQVVVRKGGFVPMLLGGALAAAVGYGAADYTQPGGFFDTAPVAEPDPFEAETRAALDAAAARLASLEGRDSGLDESALVPLNEGLDAAAAQIEALNGDLDALATTQMDLDAQLSDLDARLTQLAQAPVTDNVSEAAIAAYEEAIAGYEQEMAAMAESMSAQRAEIEGLAAAAAERESQALALAQAARVDSAAAALIVQVETGEPFAEALDAYLAAGGAPVDPALSGLANDGVPSLQGLQEAFPDAARMALAQARDTSADASDGAGGLGTFLARQLGARSVTPRDGDGADAVLSRAEAAVRSGDLATALSEIETLPEAARAALSEWEATATLRRDALAAATALTASANSN